MGLIVVLLIVGLSLALIKLWSSQSRSKVSKPYFSDPKNRKLQKRLLVLLNGDATTAERLLKQQRQRHQGQSDKWYLEKVIYDLERDRRY
ncbi:hypothetical protein [Nostoc sp. UIC 10630]|uniref:hypothetical protein n=1 Tax=Nostoc sp. UIC 10630 TaxID=2100146 RepID=UPI0013D4C642|nr:hypothetical protein [Nostoc sp. UIC 10630]MBE8996809.1 hypothetical protein [Nostoc sp. LEGE 12447]NEU80580.1 hypothetical protein [Nostoc sp. UIC 10630]